MKSFEVNFDGLVGPTHNYSGLSTGNVASTTHRALPSNPREAVLQSLGKMKTLMDLGCYQGILPPHERPHLPTLRRLGFQGSDKKIFEEVALKYPDLLSGVMSASAMWAANAATVSPSGDSSDRKVHFTPANLVSKFHRSIETQTTARILKKIFRSPQHFVHHDPMAGVGAFGDEGAANHTRLCESYGQRGLEFFVYGKMGLINGVEPKIYPARQSFEASSSIARNHKIKEEAVVYAQQNPDAIDAGVFHNDVAGVGNKNVYFCHERAYLNPEIVEVELKGKFEKICGGNLRVIVVPDSQITLDEAVKSYLFNSQLLSVNEDHMILIAPQECELMPRVKGYLDQLLSDSSQPIREVKFLDLHQSMRNGGGPACLRLRVVLSEKELRATHQKIMLTPKLYSRLVEWAKKNYRDKLDLKDLADFALVRESQKALDELTQILAFGSFYEFQK